jgi:uncharacterized membrane protein
MAADGKQADLILTNARTATEDARRSVRTEAALTEGTSRLEAFSDGVFAIAITLLILELRLPHTAEEAHPAADGSLLAVLLALWPSYFAFALSFFVILVSWMTHHDLIRLVHASNHALLLANGCVLAYVTFLPFSTSVLAAHLRGAEISTAVTFYCATFVFGSIAFNLLLETIARGRLLRPEVDGARVQGIRRSFRRIFLVYVAATVIALVAPWVALALNVAVRAYLLHIRYQSAKRVA